MASRSVDIGGRFVIAGVVPVALSREAPEGLPLGLRPDNQPLAVTMLPIALRLASGLPTRSRMCPAALLRPIPPLVFKWSQPRTQCETGAASNVVACDALSKLANMVSHFSVRLNELHTTLPSEVFRL